MQAVSNIMNDRPQGSGQYQPQQKGLSDNRDSSEIDPSDYLTELKYRTVANLSTSKLAQGIALFSLGLGLAEVLMPQRLGSAAGVGTDQRKYLPALGAREIAHGLAIMRSDKPTAAVWSRVAGDALDLAFLGAQFGAKSGNRNRLIGSVVAVLGVTALDVICAKRLSVENWSAGDRANPKAPTTVGQTSARVSA